MLWSFFELSLRKGAAVLVTLVLAWLLTPEDFGYVAMLSIFIAVGIVFVNGGLNAALIRSENVSDLDLNSVFFVNLFLGAVFYAFLFLSAPFIADFYGHERLVELIRIAGLAVIAQGFTIVPMVVLQREMRFKLQLKTTLPASVLSGLVAILLAYWDYGVWAIIAQMVLFPIINAVFLFSLKLWVFKFQFSFGCLRPLLNFSSFMLVDGVSREIFAKMYSLAVAKFFGITTAGLYFFAEKVKDLVILQLVGAIQQVTFPALSKINGDGDRLKEGYRKVVQTSILVVFPILALLAALSEPLFRFLLPEKWYGAVEYLQLMCLLGLWAPLNQINLNILMVKHRSDVIFYIGVYEKLLKLAFLLLAIPYGVTGVIIGEIIALLLAYLPKSYYMSKLLGYSVYEQIKDILPILFLSLGVSAGVYLGAGLLEWPAFYELIVLGTTGLLVYLLFAKLLKFHALELLLEMVRSRLSKVA
ncbi:lipopolysaccharide biosynthesis protein [Thiomicrorhabdus sp.]|uniref:lipopolysaccharide biosynthesis protein n=1 Tax=Thiomicrorhabdus sp. TaxID=2039724 RepID=UPI003564A0BA